MKNQTQVVDRHWQHRRQWVAVSLCVLLPLLMGADSARDLKTEQAAPPVAAALLGRGTNSLGRLTSAGTGTHVNIQTVLPPGTNQLLRASTNTTSSVKIDDSLRRMRKWMTSTNVSCRTDIIEDGMDDSKAREQQSQHQFELGLQLRQRKEYALAVKTFMALVEAEDTPRELRRSTLLELAMTAQEQQQYAKAQQILSQYVRNFSEDSSVPEILLRQGQLYRQMGANTLALAKFYAVMTVVLHLKLDHFDYYRRLVLQAQAEIADTHYMAGKYAEAADFFSRLLKTDATEFSRPEILYKLIQCHRTLAHHEETIAKSKQFTQLYPHDPKLAEVRFTLSECYRQLGHREEALQEVKQLLAEQHAVSKENPEKWLYWQLRAGNMLANQFFNEGDYFNALGLYLNLAQMNNTVEWQLPTLYQTALVYEKLRQPEKAVETYKQIVSRAPELGENPKLSLKAIVDMAKWRASYLGWRAQGDQAMHSLRPLLQSQVTTAQ
ncbi:MAG: tetratricopeptide repeat protein [Verrucomicrobiia bacterium]